MLAGNRSLSLQTDVNLQGPAAVLVATNTFNANMAGMTSNFVPPVPSFTVQQDPMTMMITFNGSVQVTLPLMLMGMIPGLTGPTFTVQARSQRKSANIMMVLDHSGPMGNGAGSPLAAVQSDASAFLNVFVAGTDNIGLVTYTGAPFLAQGLPNQNFTSNLPASINGMVAPNFSGTNTAAALSVAYQQLQDLNQPASLNVIVLFTGGLAGAFTGNFGPQPNTGTSLVTSSAYAGCNSAASPSTGSCGVRKTRPEGRSMGFPIPRRNRFPTIRSCARPLAVPPYRIAPIYS